MRTRCFPRSFDPATGVVDCSNVSGFDPKGVVVIIDSSAPTRPTLYDLTTPGFGFASVNGSVMTLAADTSALNADDCIVVYWDDGLSVGDVLLAVAAVLSPTEIAVNLATISSAQRGTLLAALMAALPKEQAIDLSVSGVAYITSAGYLAITQ